MRRTQRSRSPRWKGARKGAVGAALISAFLLVSLVPSGSSANVAEQNGGRVAKMAGELAKASDAAYVKLLKIPSTGRAWSFYQFRDSVRMIRNSAQSLTAHLQAGASYEETYPTFRNMIVRTHDAEEYLRRAGVVPDDTLAAVTHAGDVMRQLRPYFEESSGWREGAAPTRTDQDQVASRGGSISQDPGQSGR